MQLIVNDKNEIIGYVAVGSTENGVEYTGTVPDDFKTNFNPSYFLLSDGAIAVNKDYVEPTITVPNAPNAMQQIIMQQATDINGLKQLTMTQAQQIATLTKGSVK